MNIEKGQNSKTPAIKTASSMSLALSTSFETSSLSQRSSAGDMSSTISTGAIIPSPNQQNSQTSRVQTFQHNYSWEDLRRLFLVSLEKISCLEPESLPFRQPVDPEALGIRDYFDIIRKPMDLQTIRQKMNNGKYTEPWLYIDDVLRMLDNAWVYNREESKVYEYCTALAEIFQKEVNPVMYHLGYKEGKSNSFHFNSDTLNCYGRPVCLILKRSGYWKDIDSDMEFNLCETCYQTNIKATSSSDSSACSVTPDVIPNTTTQGQMRFGNNPTKSRQPPTYSLKSTSSFVFIINSSKSYSPATELHKSHMRDAEMARQLVLREFLRMLLAGDTTTDKKENVLKMLKCNEKLMIEFIRYVKRRRSIFLTDGTEGCSVVFGESFTTRDLDALLDKLKELSITTKSTGDNKVASSRCSDSSSPLVASSSTAAVLPFKKIVVAAEAVTQIATESNHNHSENKEPDEIKKDNLCP